MKRALFSVSACVLGLALSAGTLPTPSGAAASWAAFGAGLPGAAIEAEEAAAIHGGDVFMSLNENRTKLTVKVYINDEELLRLRPTPIATFEVPAHNRIVDTKEAPYYSPQGGRVPEGADLTSRPSRFPGGTWRVTEVASVSGKFGPNMIRTDAVGSVEVFAGGKSVGTYSDVGYAIHSNTNDFRYSKSLGCVIVRQEDNARIAAVLNADRADAARNKTNRRAVQLFNVTD